MQRNRGKIKQQTLVMTMYQNQLKKVMEVEPTNANQKNYSQK